MTHFLKYLSARFFFGTFAALFVVFKVLTWYHEDLYGGGAGGDDLADGTIFSGGRIGGRSRWDGRRSPPPRCGA